MYIALRCTCPASVPMPKTLQPRPLRACGHPLMPIVMATVKGYLFTIARHLFLHGLRKSSRHDTLDEDLRDPREGPWGRLNRLQSSSPCSPSCKSYRKPVVHLIPVYLAGDASPATRALIDEYLRQDPELAQRVQALSANSLATIPQPPLSSDIEVRSLPRARALIGWQKWLFGLAITFTALSFSDEFSTESGHLREFHFLIRDYPAQFGTFAALALICWVSYYLIRRRLRIGPSQF
jgi:hypothetical protein